MLHSCFTVSLLLSALPQWCTERQCNLWELLIQNVPNWMLFHLYKTMASRTDPEAKAMQASEATGDIVKSKMLSWPSPNKRGMRFSGDTFDALMTRIRERSRLALEIEQCHIGHSQTEIVAVRHFLLRKVDAELIGLNMAIYGSAAGRIELPNAAALMTMQYHIDIDDDSCLPLAEIHKSKHGDPCECHFVFNLDPRMPRCLIESFLGMCGFDYALSSTEIGLFGRSFWRLPVGSRITISEDGSWQATDTHTGAEINLLSLHYPGPQEADLSMPEDLGAAWAVYIAKLKTTTHA